MLTFTLTFLFFSYPSCPLYLLSSLLSLSPSLPTSLYSSLLFFLQCLALSLWLACYLQCCPVWLQTHSNPPTSVSQVLMFLACVWLENSRSQRAGSEWQSRLRNEMPTESLARTVFVWRSLRVRAQWTEFTEHLQSSAKQSWRNGGNPAGTTWQPVVTLALVVKIGEIVSSLEGQTKEVGEKWGFWVREAPPQPQ